ncbi:MAG: hypothetical protein HRT58_14560 [Crocinitomicaceae bacterium]|nr:hypothetical protein [Flavobacteriales bacterium]NQZ36889.1 hypothetical protein [Crocinitomicaceae bacterium]
MRYLIFPLFLIFSLCAVGQDYAYLEDIRLRKKTDFVDNEITVIKAVDYLMANPLGVEKYNRKACTRFIIKYAQKSPFITLSIDGSLLKVCEGNSDILQMYMGLWLKSAINNESKSDSFHELFIYSELYDYCNEGNGVVQTEIIKSLIQAGKDDEISSWIEDIKK